MSLWMNGAEEAEKFINILVDKIQPQNRYDNQPMKDLLFSKVFSILVNNPPVGMSSYEYHLDIKKTILKVFYDTYKKEPVYLTALFSID
jgi:hypothetical protein